MVKKRKPVRITNAEALARLERMAPLIREDVQIALAAEANLEAANDIVTATPDKTRPGARAYSAVHQSLWLNLAISLARLFDHGTLNRHPNKRHVASLPLLIRLLKQQRNRRALIGRSRRWTPMLSNVEDMHAASCERAINEAIEVYDTFAASHVGRDILARLKTFRDKRIAHALMVDTLGALPRYNDLFQLMSVALMVADAAGLAVEGLSPSLTDVKAIARAEADEFWRSAFRYDTPTFWQALAAVPNRVLMRYLIERLSLCDYDRS